MEWRGQCLSAGYINLSAKLLFQGSVGHEWPALPVSAYHKGSWCPHCNGNVKLGS